MLDGKIAQMLRATPRALVMISLLLAPVVAMQAVRASDSDVLTGMHAKSGGIGLVLIVSLQRAR